MHEHEHHYGDLATFRMTRQNLMHLLHMVYDNGQGSAAELRRRDEYMHVHARPCNYKLTCLRHGTPTTVSPVAPLF